MKSGLPHHIEIMQPTVFPRCIDIWLRKGRRQKVFICTLGPTSASMNLQRPWPLLLRQRNEWVSWLGDQMGSVNDLDIEPHKVGDDYGALWSCGQSWAWSLLNWTIRWLRWNVPPEMQRASSRRQILGVGRIQEWPQNIGPMIARNIIIVRTLEIIVMYSFVSFFKE